MIYLKNKHKTCTVKEFLKLKGLSKRTLTKLAKELGIMKIDDKPVIMTDTIYKNKTLCIDLKEPKPQTAVPLSNRPLNIVFEDEYILIIDKPNNLPTIPSHNFNDSLASQVVNYLGSDCIFRALNRLDAHTTGLVVIVKDVITENLLVESSNIKKWYLAKVEGKTLRRGCINAPIIDDENQHKRVVDKNGLPAITYYKRLHYKNGISLVRCNLVYGRTNQIRCHFSYIGHPLVDDYKYNTNCKTPDAIFYLRCYKLRFKHPYTNKVVKIKI